MMLALGASAFINLGPVHMERAGSVKRAGPPRRDLSCIMISTKNTTCVHMRSGPARLTEISPETAEISASRDGNFPCEHMLVSQPGQPG